MGFFQLPIVDFVKKYARKIFFPLNPLTRD